MQFSVLIQEVKNIVQDSSFDDSIPGYVNEAFLQASGRINIPDLKRVGIATTVSDQIYVSLSGIDGGFSGRLSKILSTTIDRYKDLETMLSCITSQSRDLTEVGAVEMVALEGKTLWYFPSPATEQEIQCVLFSNPVLLENDLDTPDAFPEICHRNIGVHGAAFLAYQIIEEGIDGAKVNTDHHFAMYEKGITQLQEWIGRHRVHYITSTLNDGVSTTDWTSSFPRWRNVQV